MNHKLDDLTLAQCPALKTPVTLGMCRKICKFYEVSWRDGLEHCDYPINWPISLVESAAKHQKPMKVPKKVHEIVQVH